MDLANSAVKNALERFLDLHKDAKTDNEFMTVGFDIIQTLLNNIHMAQSHMFATLIGGITKESHNLLHNKYNYMSESKCTVGCKNILHPDDTAMHLKSSHDNAEHKIYSSNIGTVECKNILQTGWAPTGIFPNDTAKDSLSHTSLHSKENYDNMSLGGIEVNETEINDYMTQFSNTLPAISKLNTNHDSLELNPISKKGPIDNWLQKMRESSRQSTYNVFDEDSRVTICTELQDQCNATAKDSLSYTSLHSKENYDNMSLGCSESLDECKETCVSAIWHNKINMDVEQCCARIGNKIFMIEHMEPEFMDNYPPDTYIDGHGIVHGHPCLRTIDTKLFEKGQIFCNDHASGYEDIRMQLIAMSCKHSDINLM